MSGLSREQLQALSEEILDWVRMIDEDPQAIEMTRAVARALPLDEAKSILLRLDMAEAIASRKQLAMHSTTAVPAVRQPAYRKGTCRKVVSWATCLWQPK